MNDKEIKDNELSLNVKPGLDLISNNNSLPFIEHKLTEFYEFYFQATNKLVSAGFYLDVVKKVPDYELMPVEIWQNDETNELAYVFNLKLASRKKFKDNRFQVDIGNPV